MKAFIKIIKHINIWLCFAQVFNHPLVGESSNSKISFLLYVIGVIQSFIFFTYFSHSLSLLCFSRVFPHYVISLYFLTSKSLKNIPQQSNYCFSRHSKKSILLSNYLIVSFQYPIYPFLTIFTYLHNILITYCREKRRVLSGRCEHTLLYLWSILMCKRERERVIRNDENMYT